MKVIVNCLVLVLFTSCFGLFDKKDTSKVKLNPSGSNQAATASDESSNTNENTEQNNEDGIAQKTVLVKVDGSFTSNLDNDFVKQGALANAITSLSQYNPRLIVIAQFLGASDEQAALVSAMKNSNSLVILSGFAIPGQQNYELPPVHIAENDGFVTEAQRIIIPSRELGEASGGVGIYDLTGDTSNYNDMPLVIAKNGKLFPSVALKVIATLTGETIVYYKEYVTIGEKPFKIQSNGSDGGGSFNSNFKTVSYSDLSSGNASVDLTDKIIVLDANQKFNYRGQQRTVGEILINKVNELANKL